MAASNGVSSVSLDKYSCWMENLPLKKHFIPLRGLTIPGSHDSGAFRLEKNVEVAVDQPELSLGGLFGRPVKTLLYNWSKTQSLNIFEQLQAGIRYLDFRAALRYEDNKFYLLHRLYGAGLVEALEDVKKFASKHPKEIIIIHFQHFYNMDIKAHENLVSILQTIFQDALRSPGEKAINATLQEIWQNGSNVIIIYKEDEVASRYPFLWPHHFIQNPWGNTDDEAVLIEFLSKQCDQSTFPQHCFHVTQAILSPQASTIEENLASSLKDNLVLKCNEHVCNWLRDLCASSGKQCKFNIIMADFVEYGQFIATVVDMNYIY